MEWLQVLAGCVRCAKRQNVEHALVLLVLHELGGSARRTRSLNRSALRTIHSMAFRRSNRHPYRRDEVLAAAAGTMTSQATCHTQLLHRPTGGFNSANESNTSRQAHARVI
jgi:hypothetical protein